MNEQRQILVEYGAILRRHKWIFLVAVLATGIAAYAYASRQPQRFEANSQVLLNTSSLPTTLVGTSTTDSSADAVRYDQTQAVIAHTLPVAVAAVAAKDPLTHQRILAGTNVTPSALLQATTISSNPNNDILAFTSQDADSSTAVKMTNAYAQGYVDYRHGQDAQNLDAAVRSLNKQITAETAKLNVAKAKGESPVSYAKVIGKLSNALNAITTFQAVSAGGQQGAQVSKTAAGATQTEPKVVRNTAIGLALGVALGMAMVLLREAVDTRIHDADEVAAALGMTLLGRLATPARSLKSNHQLSTLVGSTHGSEAYRKLRVNVDFANLHAGAKSILVTSAVEREGKSTTVANLAVAMAQSGRRVVLVDLDLRKPTLGRFFGLDGPGVTEVAMGHISLGDALKPVVVSGEHSLPTVPSFENGNGVAQTGGVLHVLTAGTIPPNPAEFVETQALRNMLAELEAESDIVLIDTPPVLPVGDAITLSRYVGGMIVIVRLAVVRRATLTELRRATDVCAAAKLGFILTAAEDETGYGDKYGYGYEYGSAPAGTTAPQAPREPVEKH